MADVEPVRVLVSLSFYGGVGEIGGNKVLLEDGDTRIFIDFGMSFARKEVFYGDFLGPRIGAALARKGRGRDGSSQPLRSSMLQSPSIGERYACSGVER